MNRRAPAPENTRGNADKYENKGFAKKVNSELCENKGVENRWFAERSAEGEDGIVAAEVGRAVGRGIGASVAVEYSRWGTQVQLVGGTVEAGDRFHELKENVSSVPNGTNLLGAVSIAVCGAG
jgi:hypothetical protein